MEEEEEDSAHLRAVVGRGRGRSAGLSWQFRHLRHLPHERNLRFLLYGRKLDTE